MYTKEVIYNIYDLLVYLSFAIYVNIPCQCITVVVTGVVYHAYRSHLLSFVSVLRFTLDVETHITPWSLSLSTLTVFPCIGLQLLFIIYNSNSLYYNYIYPHLKIINK